MEDHVDLKRKIVKALNEEVGSDLKQLHKLKDLYDETKTIQENLREKVISHQILHQHIFLLSILCL